MIAAQLMIFAIGAVQRAVAEVLNAVKSLGRNDVDLAA